MLSSYNSVSSASDEFAPDLSAGANEAYTTYDESVLSGREAGSYPAATGQPLPPPQTPPGVPQSLTLGGRSATMLRVSGPLGAAPSGALRATQIMSGPLPPGVAVSGPLSSPPSGRLGASGPLRGAHTSGDASAPERGRATGGLGMRAPASQGLSGLAQGVDAWAMSTDLIQTCLSELERLGREMGELKMLLKQDTQELAKFTQRKEEAASRVEEIEPHLEHYSRQQIRAVYLDASEAEMGSFMLTEHIEHLEGKLKVFERYSQFLTCAAEVLQALQTARSALSVAPAIPQQASAPVTGVSAVSRPRAAVSGAPAPTAPPAAVVAPAEGPGLAASLQRYTAGLATKYGVEVRLLLPGEELTLPLEAEVPLFRIVQEALPNAIRAGKAKHVQVSVSRAANTLNLAVQDDGAGFDVEATAHTTASKGHGLARMRKYAESLGGQLTIESRPGVGTRVALSLALTQ